MIEFLKLIPEILFPSIFVSLLNLSIFVAFLYYLWQLLKIRKSMFGWKTDGQTKDLFQNKLEPIFAPYHKSRTYLINGIKKTDSYADEFFKPTQILNIFNVNISAVKSASGTLIGMGLLGTFIGLTMGVSKFDATNSTEIESSIQSLLSGMGAAFSTSLVGMSLSLIYGIIEKKFLTKTERYISSLCTELDAQYLLSDVELSEYKTFYLLNKLEFKNTDGQLILPGNLLQNIYNETSDQTKEIRGLATDIGDRLNEDISNIMSEQFEKLNGTLGDLAFKMDELAKTIQQPADDMTRSIVEDLQSSMKQMALDFRESLSGDATNNLEGLAKNLDQAGTALLSFPEHLREMTTTMQGSFENIRALIEKQSENASAVSDQAVQEMRNTMDDSASTMSQVLTEVKSVIEGITHNTSQVNSDMMVAIQNSIQNIQHKTEESSGLLADTTQAQVSFMIDQFGNLSKDLNKKYEQIASIHSKINTGSSSMIEQYDDSVRKMYTVNKQIQETAERFVALQKESESLNSALISASNQINLASNAFKDIQANLLNKQDTYLTKFDHVISKISETLESTGNSMKVHTEDFDSIKTGLSGIFTDLNSGLNQYSSTVQSSTQNFLSDYSNAIKEATSALSSVAQEQSDITHELKEVVENIRR